MAGAPPPGVEVPGLLKGNLRKLNPQCCGGWSLDHLEIWSTNVGDELHCSRDVVMEDGGEVAFTAGRRYRVQSVHPIANPPFIRVIDDQGEPHGLGAADLSKYFLRR